MLDQVNQADVPKKLTQARFLVLDVETTGLDPLSDAIVSVAAVAVDYGAKTVEPLLKQRVNPGRKIPPEASAIHHILDADVKDAPAWEETVKPIVFALMDEFDVMVAHNARFDSGFIAHKPPWLCTRRLAAHLWPEAPNYQNQTLRYFLNIDVKGTAHDASDDATVTGHILLRALEEYEKHGGADDVRALMAYADSAIPVSTMPFGKHRGKPLQDVPMDYLRWALTNLRDLDPDLRTAIERCVKPS